MRRHQFAFAAFALGVALVAPAASGAGQHSKRLPVRTLATVGGQIDSFAQDGNRIAWLAGPGDRSEFDADCTIAIRTLGSTRQSQLRRVSCNPSGFVLGGDQVLGYTVAGGTVTHINAWTWIAGQRRARSVGEYLWEYDGGELISGLAADATTLVYGTLGYRGCDDGGCERLLVGGNVHRVGRNSATTLFNVPPAGLAVNSGRIAVIPMESNTRPVMRHPIEVRSAVDGSVITQFMPNGEATEIALSPRFAAALVQHGRNRPSVELFDPTSGASLGAARVPSRANSLSVAGRTVVFATGQEIWMLDAIRRTPSPLAVARTRPIGLSIEGRRVAWAESGRKHSRIRAVRIAARR